MQKHTSHFLLIIIYSLIGIALFTPHLASADTYVEGKTLSHDEVWDSQASPYHVRGTLTIPKGVSLTISPGVQVFIEVGHIDVRGTLTMEGTSDNRISIRQDTASTGFTMSGGDLRVSHADIVGGKKVLYASASSTVNIESSTVKSVSGSSSAFYLQDGSILHLTESDVSDIHTTEGFEVSYGSSAYIYQVTFDDVGQDDAFYVGSSSSSGSLPYLSLEYVAIEHGHTAIEVFNHAKLYLIHCNFDFMTDAGVRAHDHADVSFLNAIVSNSLYGLYATDSIMNVQNSPIHRNRQNGYYFVNVLFTDINNFYNTDESNFITGTYSESSNSSTTSATTSTTTNATTTSVITPCCSNVLFIPGLESSRLYKKMVSGENQLWEPNINADVTKLYLNTNGTPKDSTIYTRDIINKTNLTLGIYDKEIYKGFTDHLDSLRSSGVINTWSAFPYDWRKAPSSIVEKDEQSEAQFKKLEDAVTSLASTSKTHKVTIIGHSYGGVITKYFLKYLAKKGKASLVDDLVLVAVPEQGTAESIGALLHGDDQEIFDGLFLNNVTARTLSLNMPSAYYLLPNATLLADTHNKPILQHEKNSWFNQYTDFTELDKGMTESTLKLFLLGTKHNRPYAHSIQNINLPALLNESLYKSAVSTRDTMDADEFYKSLSVGVYNIVGTGIDTVVGYEYYKKECDQYSIGFISTKPDPYCGFGHQPLFNIKGDGTVGMGNMSKRWGTKLVFNVGAYNIAHNSNNMHADIMLTDSVNETIEKILHKDSTLTSQFVSLYQDSSSAALDPTTLSVTGQKIQYSVNDIVDMQTTNSTGALTGYVDTNINKKIMHQKVARISNSSYRHVGDMNHLIVPRDLTHIQLIPTHVPNAGTDEFGEPKVSYISFTAKTLSTSTDSTLSTSPPLYTFTSVPIIPTSKIVVEILQGSTTPAVLHLDLYGDGHSETLTPTVTVVITASSSLLASSSTPLTHISTSTAGTSTTATSTIAGPIDIHALIQELKRSISSSTIRSRFQSRYIIRLDSIDRYLVKKKVSYAGYLAKRNADSLFIISRDLERAVPWLYRGGMLIKEVDILKGMFDRLVHAFSFVL